ncbi:MAG: histidine kinase [Bacteroidetes bacterium]|nr:histidine kinase [Bacteroidota bacterium]
MKVRLLLCFVFLITANLLGQKTVNITFKVSTPVISDTSTIYIAGNKKALGSWNPAAVFLEKMNESEWSKQIQFEKGDILEFKFTKGSWETEAVDSAGNTPQNYIITVSEDTTLSFNIDKWKDEFGSKIIVKGQITGTIQYHKNLKGKGLLPRDVLVWLPPDYYADTFINYPVLYMHDAQNLFDPATSSFGVDWQIDEAADSLIRCSLLDPFIIVGINNTIDRKAEYTITDKGSAYMKFIVENVKPMIDSLYRTKPDRDNTVTGGSSAGGLISFMLLWEYNKVFAKAICMSPAYKVKSETTDINFVDDVENYNGIKKQIKLYIDNGGIGLEAILQPGIDDMINTLKNKGYIEGKDFLWIKDPESAHSEAAWAKRIPGALKFIFSK